MIIHHVFDEDTGTEGMFDEAGQCLGAWHENDANWRNEYFDGFIEALGHEFSQPTPEQHAVCVAVLRERFGYESDENESDGNDNG